MNAYQSAMVSGLGALISLGGALLPLLAFSAALLVAVAGRLLFFR